LRQAVAELMQASEVSSERFDCIVTDLVGV